jgi:hypothetical protein
LIFACAGFIYNVDKALIMEKTGICDKTCRKYGSNWENGFS